MRFEPKKIKEAFYSIRFRVWLMFIIFALLIIAFLYIFQVVMLGSYYQHMKTIETSDTVSRISNTWHDAPEELSSTVTRLSKERGMYIEVSDSNKVYARSNFFSKTNQEIAMIINSLDEEQMERYQNGEDVYSMTTMPRSKDGEKAIVMISTIAEPDDVNEVYTSHGKVRVYIFNYLEPIGTTSEIIYSQLNLTAVLIILAAFVVSVFFSNSITKPIVRISRSALMLPQGKFHLDTKKHRFLEIDELTQTLNAASDEIAKSDNLSKELMANISHDLRTPLTMIKAYAEMIRDLSGDNPEKREKHLKVIIDETDRLSSLVNDILDLSKLQSGVAELHQEVFDFSQHLKDLTSRFSLLNEVQNYKILLSCDPDIYIKADITKLEQVVYNFINNAINYTGEDKTIKISLYRKPDNIVRFEVQDSGVGIDEENIKYVWNRYYKVKRDGETHQRAVTGSGLGLSIVKGVLDMHGFNYGVDSKVGVGSTFWFECKEYKESKKKA